MNEDRRIVYNDILIELNNSEVNNEVFFVDGPGGTGKTFLHNALIDKLNLDGMIVVAVESSGIASLLLNGGRTAHSTFKIPIPIHETSTCYVSLQSDLADFLHKIGLIIWDEAPMGHKYAFEALDRTFRDVMCSIDSGLENVLFSGKVILLGGDFRQVLPVVPRGGRYEIVNACFKTSYMWNVVKLSRLAINMRVKNGENDDSEYIAFSKFLLNLGDGKIRHEKNLLGLDD